jgi:rubrerythrin
MKDMKRLNALEAALNNELREREFYYKNAKRTTNPVGKVMFQQIGDDELEHYKKLKALHETWEKAKHWPETIPLKVRDTVVRDILKEASKKSDQLSKGDADDLQAIRIALEFEAKGEKYYAELRDEVSDPKEKAFFDLLSRMEREHYLSLKDVEELMTDPVSWYRRKERHGVDGA